MANRVREAVRRVATAAKALGISVAEALQEKADELELRAFVKSMPNDRLKEDQHPAFLEEVFGTAPAPELLQAIRLSARGPRLGEKELIELEDKQNGRCALCGQYLSVAVSPQVDHIRPLALGGRNEKANYQLLCRICNQGKSAFLHWIMGAPFFLEESIITTKMRYCVLARDRGKCGEPTCEETSSSSAMRVLPVVSTGRGGRLIFDNLRTYCEPHAEERQERWKREAVSKLRQTRIPVVRLRLA
jgi:5-methylcytosine-specific restriction endonuclease McrA